MFKGKSIYGFVFTYDQIDFFFLLGSVFSSSLFKQNIVCEINSISN